MSAGGISCDVDDAAMIRAVGSLGLIGMQAAAKRAVLKTAQLATAELKVATRAAMYDNPGGYAPFKSANFRRPRIRTRGGVISAGAGYTRAGYVDRFRSTGTKPRYRRGRFTHAAKGSGGFTGSEIGLGMVQTAAMASDPVYPLIAEVELQVELKKRGL
jgi:hypothetical protein